LFEAKPTPILNALKTANMVRLRQVQLERWYACPPLEGFSKN